MNMPGGLQCLITSLLLVTGFQLVANGADGHRSYGKDSYRYYGPQGLWEKWDSKERVGRDTWIFWTWGNQKFLRGGAEFGGHAAVPVSVDFFRLLDSRRRGERFKRFGLINEPNFQQAMKPDRHGLWLDVWEGDDYYPGTDNYPLKNYPETNTPIDNSNYGLAQTEDSRGTGIVGLRLFNNPKFNAAEWDVKKYFANPGKIQPPYLVGFSCAFCHMGFDPTKPPLDPEHPRWENLAANIGNQYFREGELFLAGGRIVLGGSNPGPSAQDDPYDTEGIGPNDFLYHYATTQQPGTSETSRISYDFINNPNTINAFWRLSRRPTFTETAPNGQSRTVMHVLKDGADSVGLEWALMRVPINIGCEGHYWSGKLFNPVTGHRQKPFRIAEVLSVLPPAERQELTTKWGIDFQTLDPQRMADLRAQLGPDFGQDWRECWKRIPWLSAYLLSYDGFKLTDAAGAEAYLTKDQNKLARGREVFAEQCAQCHSSRQPPADLTPEKKKAFHLEQLSDVNLAQNFLSDDRRYPVTMEGLNTNLGRALATNAIDGDVWAEFSSKEYKALEPLGVVTLHQRPYRNGDAVSVEFSPPGGGRGYYRTPTLISMWATAPYLHNNSLGKYTGKVDLASRMAEFEDGCEKLLWPQKRDMHIKRTTAPSTFAPDLPQHLPKLLARHVMHFLAVRLQEKLPKTAVQKLAEELEPVLEAGLRKTFAELRGKTAGELRAGLTATLEQKIGEFIGKLQLAPSIEATLKELAKQAATEQMSAIHQALALDVLTVPEGTPINLYLNLNVSALPYAAIAHFSQSHDRTKLAQTLLELSDCPDLVEDKGHTFGSGLSDDDKRALIEFLKTL